MEDTPNVDLIPCGCGCGEFRPRLDKRGRVREFIWHHCPIGKFKDGDNRGRNHYHWKGGKIITTQGYIAVKAYGHPRANNHYVLEHDLIMEQYLGRYLEKDELVHHINGIKTDNRIENLNLSNRIGHPTLHKKKKN